MKAWAIIRDILLTGVGLGIIVKQGFFTPHPRDVLLVVAMALTVPAIAEHTQKLLSGQAGVIERSSLPPAHPPGGTPSTSLPPEEGEHE